MRSKTIALIIACLFPAVVIAQRANPEPVLVSLPQGGFVSFVNRPEWIDLRQAIRSSQLPGPLGSQALPDANQTIHRILRDRDGGFVFGYDLWISADRVTKQFKIAIRPLDSRLETSLRPTGSAAPESPSTFPKSTEAQTLSDGSEFSVDILINQNTGVKMVDIVKVSFDRSSLGGDGLVPRARDFSADAVAMEMKDYSLLMNDELITTGKSKTGSSGALLWLYVPRRGRLIFSLVPRPDYAFEKVGTVSGNKIEFSIRGDHFEWVSSAPILREEGTWNLWVLSDPKYLPLTVTMAPPPQEKGTLEKLDDKLNTVLQKSPVSAQLPTGLQKTVLDRMEKSAAPDKVMFGAADRIENLLPRN
jgi:hypothetical protein